MISLPESEAGCSAIVCILALAASIAIWPISSYFEASAYERVTGKQVSTWDAMWLELRVIP